MSETADQAEATLRAARASYEALGDELGAHLCDVALVQLARDRGPRAVLAAVAGPLARMSRDRDIVGVDAIAVELILAARDLGVESLEERVRALVARARRPRLVAVVLEGLLDAAAERVDEGDDETGRATMLSALELAVEATDLRGGARVLQALAGFHERRDERDPEILCLDQAATYLERAGEPCEAAELRLRAAERLSADEGDEPDPRALAMLARAADGFREAGESRRAVECLLHLADEQIRRAHVGGALETLREAEALAPSLDDAPLEVRIYERMADAWEAVGDAEMAGSCRARARLLQQ
ncbi:MAG: hypothetical protein ACQEXJ_10730 [Myxococcota bacterium]